MDTDKTREFEMQAYRRITRIIWVSETSNVEVLRGSGEETEIVNTFKIRKYNTWVTIIRGEKYTPLRTIKRGKEDTGQKKCKKNTHFLVE